MRTVILCALSILICPCLRAEDSFITETGGVEIVLSNGWERLDQPANFYVQKRARNPERGIALSAGSFVVDLTLEQCAAVGLVAMESGTDTVLEKVAKEIGVSKEDVEKSLASRIGRQLVDGLKQTSRIMRFETLKVNKTKVDGETRFEIHVKMVVIESGQTIFSRQFLLPGSSPHEIVEITYAGGSEDIFTDKDLADAIHPKTQIKKTATLPAKLNVAKLLPT
jgi:hypothetical protein